MGELLRFVSLVLSYPEDVFDYKRELRELRQTISLEEGLFQRLKIATENIFNKPLLVVQSHYVDIFDRGKGCSLYLFEHAYGDSLNRGEALVRLSQVYLENGYEYVNNELPDYIPMYFELLSVLSFNEAKKKMKEIERFLKNIHGSLMGYDADYANVLFGLMSFLKLEEAQDEFATKSSI